MWHATHSTLPSPWDMEAETQNYLVKAVVGLLQEAVPYGSSKNRDQEEAHRKTMMVLSTHEVHLILQMLERFEHFFGFNILREINFWPF